MNRSHTTVERVAKGVRHGVWMVLVLALAVRVAYVLEIEASPLFDAPVVDARTYADHAARLAGGNWLGKGEGPFWQPPLYPYFLGVIRWLFPDSFFHAARLAQALLGALSSGLVLWIGQWVFNPVVGLVAGLAAALYGPLIFFDGELLPASLATFVDLAGLALLLRAWRRPKAGGFLASGAVFGLAGLAVPTVLVFAVMVPVALLRRFAHRQGHGLVGAFLLGVILPMAPVAARNYFIGGDAVLISYNLGVNFYLGNNSDYERTLSLRPGWEWDDLVGLPLKEGIVRPAEKSAYFMGKAWEYMRQEPLAWMGLMMEKMAQFWHGDEIGRNQGLYFWRKYSAVLSASLWKGGMAFPFGLAGPLALWGLLLSLRRLGLTLPAMFVLSYFMGVIAFFVTARYRLPAVPVLLVFAAYGAHQLWIWAAEQRWRPLALGLAVCLAFALGVNYRVGLMDLQGDAAIHYNLGNAHARKGEKERAMESFERAVALDPLYWQAWLNLGALRAGEGALEEAVEIFARVAGAEPGRAEVWFNLAHAQVLRGKYRDALQAYWQVLEIDPGQRQAYAEAISLYLRLGDEANAERVLRQALALYPQERDQLLAMYAALKERLSRKDIRP